jgi:EAL domain-containing protein (putative c-di-GMP-specific phosphodiesterase class I)
MSLALTTNKKILPISRLTGGFNPSITHQEDITTLLQDIIKNRKLTALFQPIINLKTGDFYGYEGLIRGPSDSLLHAPISLFGAATEQNLLFEIEMLSRQIVLETFVFLNLPGNLFLNVSPESLLHPSFKNGCTLGFLQTLGLPPDRVVIELTENQPIYDFERMRNALLHYRAMGFKIAIDDLGEGFSSLRLWSELQPEFIKIDMHFVQGVNSDPVKLQILKSIQLIAHSCGTKVIAEGIETALELSTIRNIEIMFGQGYFIARPSPTPLLIATTETTSIINDKNDIKISQDQLSAQRKVFAQKLLQHIEPAHPETTNEIVLERFTSNPSLRAIPVVQQGIPVGVIIRSAFLDNFVKPFQRELLGKNHVAFPCKRSHY